MSFARRAALSVMAAVLIALATPTAAHAHDPWVGVRLGYYSFSQDDPDRVLFDHDGASIGIELLTRVAHRVYFNPNVDYIFVDGGKEATFNLDFHYDLPTRERTVVWLGAGVGLHWQDPEDPVFDSRTDPAVNFFAGVGYKDRRLIPYAQAKFVASKNPGFQVAVGVRF